MELISMSIQEISRLEIMQKLHAKQLKQASAAEQLNLTVRQATRQA